MKVIHRATSAIALSFLVSACFGEDGDACPDGGQGQMCTSNAECSADLVCTSGTCQSAGSVGLGGSCWANRDCEPDLYCSPTGICAPAGGGDVGDPCGSGGECRPDLYCEVAGLSGTCEEPGDTELGEACSETADCIAGLACGPEGTCQHPTVAFPPFTGVECEPDEDPFRVFFEVPRSNSPPADFFRLPFPNDARVSAAGELDLSDFPRPGPGALGVDLAGLYADALEEDFRGFSSVARVAFRFSGELDFDTATGDAVHYVDVTPDAPEFGRQRGRAWSYSSARGLYHCQHYFVVGNEPGDPLLPEHTYAVYLTTDLLSASGDAAAQDPDLEAVLAGTRPDSPAELARAWDAYQPLREYLSSEGIDPATVAGAAVFTTMDPSARLRDLEAAVSAEAAPELKDMVLCDSDVESPCEDASGRGACSAAHPEFHEIHGRFTVPIYQEGTAPYETPAEGGAIADPPQRQRTEDVCFALTVPKETMPDGGWPVVVFGHGTGGGYSGVVASGVATALATAGVPAAVFSFDGVAHGERKADSERTTDSLVFNVINPSAARDNHLQGAVDVMQALRLPQVGEVDVPGAGTTRFDAGQVVYFGHSQGSNVGLPAVAVQDRAAAAIFSGAGSFLTRALLTKTSPVNARAGLELLLGEELSTSHPVMTIWQTYFDGVDTLNYSPLLLRRPPESMASKHVLMTWGSGDTFSPVPTLNATARAAGLAVAEPVVEDLETGSVARPISENEVAGDGPSRTAAVFQYEPDGYDGHFVSTRDPGAIADWVAFVTSLIQDGTPTVP